MKANPYRDISEKVWCKYFAVADGAAITVVSRAIQLAVEATRQVCDPFRTTEKVGTEELQKRIAARMQELLATWGTHGGS